jgi:hypothetical protein
MTPLAKAAWDSIQRQLSTDALNVLWRGLCSADSGIMQGESAYPSLHGHAGPWRFQRGDPLAYALYHTGTVERLDLAEANMRTVLFADAEMGRGAAFFWWWDCTGRDVAFAELAVVVQDELQRRLAVGLQPSAQ